MFKLTLVTIGISSAGPGRAPYTCIATKFESQLSHRFEIDHESISMDILSLLVIQEGQLSVTCDGEKYVLKVLVNRLEE